MVTLTRVNREFKDISLAFTPNPINGDITVLKNERAISNSLKNCVMIAVSEVPFDNEMGSIVNQMLFEVADEMTMDDISEEIRRTIARNEPRVEVKDLIINYDENNAYDISVYYVIKGNEEVLILDFILTPSTT